MARTMRRAMARKRTPRPVDAFKRIGGLSDPDKMPCESYSTPAEDCITGSKLAPVEGTVCFFCYARKGCYLFKSTREAMARRMEAVRSMLASPIETAQWVSDFAAVLNYRCECTERWIKRTGAPTRNDGRYFRWHDSGDLQSVGHLRAIVAVADATPSVRHWLPTREAGIVRAYLSEGGTFPRNLVVRLSLSRVDQTPAPVYLKLADVAGVSLSGVHSDTPAKGFERCTAEDREGHCADCRACWSEEIWVSYHQH